MGAATDILYKKGAIRIWELDVNIFWLHYFWERSTRTGKHVWLVANY